VKRSGFSPPRTTFCHCIGAARWTAWPLWKTPGEQRNARLAQSESRAKRRVDRLLPVITSTCEGRSTASELETHPVSHFAVGQPKHVWLTSELPSIPTKLQQVKGVQRDPEIVALPAGQGTGSERHLHPPVPW